MSETTWGAAADGSRARLFEPRRFQHSLELVFDEARSQLRDRELMRDSNRPGRIARELVERLDVAETSKDLSEWLGVASQIATRGVHE